MTEPSRIYIIDTEALDGITADHIALILAGAGLAVTQDVYLALPPYVKGYLKPTNLPTKSEEE